MAQMFKTRRQQVRRITSVQRAVSRAALDACEPRRLFASVSGFVFGDHNGNGTRDGGEPGLDQVIVYADLNGNGKRELGPSAEPAISAGGGAYSFNVPTATAGSSVSVRLDYVPDSFITGPGGPSRTATFATASSNAIVGDIGVAVLPNSSSAFGTVRSYRNSEFPNGAQPVAGKTVWDDIDGDGVIDAGEPSTTTNADGTYALLGLPLGADFSFRLLGSPTNLPGYSYGGEGRAVPTLYSANINITRGTGTLTLRPYRDTNPNGTPDAGDSPLLFASAWIDLNRNRLLDSGEQQFVEGPSPIGSIRDYSLALPLGEFPIAYRFAGDADLVADGVTTAINGSEATPTVVPLRLNAVAGTASVYGTVYADADRDGTRDAGEAGLAGKTVYADLDYDGVKDANEPSAVTTAAGAYGITGIAPQAGSVAIRLLDVATSLITAPAGGLHSGRFTSAYVANGRDFGVATSTGPAPTAGVTGTVFGDVDGDGVRDAGETGVSGKTVYADLDYDGVKDANEPSAVTDGSGFYSIGGIAPQSTSVAIRLLDVPPSQITAPTGGFHSGKFTSAYVAANRNFGVRAEAPADVTLRVLPRLAQLDAEATYRLNLGLKYFWLDANLNSRRDADEPLLTRDTTGNPAAPPFVLNLAPGTPYRIVAGRYGFVGDSAYSPATVEGIAGTGATDVDMVVPDFSNIIFGAVFNDVDGDGVLDAGESIGGPGGGAVRVFADFNGNGILEPDEPRANTLLDAAHPTYNGYFALAVPNNLNRPAFALRFVSLPGGYQLSTIPTGTTPAAFGRFDLGFRVAPAPVAASVSGTVFGDLDFDAARDPGEAAIAGRTVFADYNENRVLDAGEPSAVSDASGNYTLAGPLRPGPVQVRLVPTLNSNIEPARTVTIVAGQHLSGLPLHVTANQSPVGFSPYYDDNANRRADLGDEAAAVLEAWVDLDRDGRRDAGEPSFAQQRSTPKPDGYLQTNYLLVEGGSPRTLPVGNYQIAYRLAGDADAVADGTFELQVDSNLGSAEVAIARPQSLPNRAAIATGSVFADADFDGVRDAGEAGIADRIVYADSNYNGRLDVGESQTLTDGNGNYTLAGVRSDGFLVGGNSVFIRLLTAPTETLSTPTSGLYSERFGPGTYGGRNFGVVRRPI